MAQVGKKKKRKRAAKAAAKPVVPVFEVPRFGADGRFLGHELATPDADGVMRALGDDELDALRYRTARGPV